MDGKAFLAAFSAAALAFTLSATTYTSASYVQREHLIAQWDAIDNVDTGTHDPTAKVWKNLASTGSIYDLTLTNSACWKNGDGGSPVDDKPVAVLPAGAVRERQVVGAAGAGEVLPHRRVRVVRARTRVVDAVPLGDQVFPPRIACAGVGGGIERKRERRRRNHQQ